MKKHWIRKHCSSGPVFCSDDGTVKNRYYYDAWSVCGRFVILNGTIFRDQVTCKTCLKIMRKNENNATTKS